MHGVGGFAQPELARVDAIARVAPGGEAQHRQAVASARDRRRAMPGAARGQPQHFAQGQSRERRFGQRDMAPVNRVERAAEDADDVRAGRVQSAGAQAGRAQDLRAAPTGGVGEIVEQHVGGIEPPEQLPGCYVASYTARIRTLLAQDVERRHAVHAAIDRLAAVGGERVFHALRGDHGVGGGKVEAQPLDQRRPLVIHRAAVLPDEFE